jgi:cytochrome c-type biogenesis protein
MNATNRKRQGDGWKSQTFFPIIALMSIQSANAFTPAPHRYTASKFANPTNQLPNISRRLDHNDALTRPLFRRRETIPPSPTTLHQAISSIEDLIFTTQNAASILANTVISDDASNLKSILLLYTAGLWTSFSPCSLGLLPLTVSYITTAAQERTDKNTTLPTIAFAMGLALVFTALGVSASLLGGVFGGGGGGEGTLSSLLLAAVGSLVSVLMGLQLLELIEIPLPSLDFRLRSAVLDTANQKDSLFDSDGGLIMENLKGSGTVNGADDTTQQQHKDDNNEFAGLLRIFLLGGTSALVASPCATPVLASLLAYLAMASSSISTGNELTKGVAWMLSYTLGYSTPLLFVGATGGQALVNLQNAKNGNDWRSTLGQWITPLTGGVLIVFGMNGFLVALLGDPSLAALAPIIE